MTIYAVQTTYPTSIPVGYPGMPATMHGWDADSMIVETVAGIGFGLAVSKGTSEKQIILGGTAAGFKGVTYRDITTVNNASADVYPRYAVAGVMLRGDIWVLVKEAVLQTDAVAFDTATGKFGKTGQSVIGARWMRNQSVVDGICLLRLNSPQAAGVAIP